MTEVKRNTGANALRRGRYSVPNASYFLTICIEPREPLLTGSIANTVRRAFQTMAAEQVWQTRCATVMPDHVHLLVILGQRLTLSQAVARFKAATRPELAARNAGWQSNYYDHRVRPSDSIEAIIRYIWLNPYAAGIVNTGEEWPYFDCAVEDWAWFSPNTDAGMPFPEWLR